MAAERLRQFASAAAAAAVSIARPNYFDTGKRGEIYELRGELNNDLAIVRKEAVKKVIASMTTGKDVSALFPDVLKNVQTEDIELKKLVYLYLMNYAKSQPELDSEDSNPLVRALAIRTMGCLRVDKVLDYLCEPLRRGLKDENAYVRKTAAICVVKVVELSPELAEENGFIDMLKEMLSDGNAIVIANVVAALSDIHAHSPDLGALKMDSRIASRLVMVLNDCTEWGQITILDALAHYVPESVQEAVQFVEKIGPRLQHVNCSVVLSAIKVIIVYMEILGEEHEMSEMLKKKLAPPLVSMLSSPPEIQYVALRNIALILQKHRDILAQGVRVFFCKFNDPLYVKIEKLEIIILLVDEENFEQVISELAEYAREVDVEFAKRSTIAISKCACKIKTAKSKVFPIFEQLLTSVSGSIIQSVAIALPILLRSDVNEGHHLVTTLLSNELDMFDADEARAAIAWMLGQYGHDLKVTKAYFDDLVANFSQEPNIVQSELLIAGLKLFFQDHETYRPYLQRIIDYGIIGTENADLRERSIMYGRLLEIDSALLQSLKWTKLGLGSPHPICLSNDLLDQLLPQIATLASIYYRLPPSSHVGSTLNSIQHPPSMPDLLDLDDNLPSSPTATGAETHSPVNSEQSRPIVDLLAD